MGSIKYKKKAYEKGNVAIVSTLSLQRNSVDRRGAFGGGDFGQGVDVAGEFGIAVAGEFLGECFVNPRF